VTATLLVEALASLIDLTAVAVPDASVTYEAPRAENQDATGLVYGADPLASDGTPGPLRAGRKTPREEGAITVVCECLAASQLEADRANVILVGRVETVVADNPKLGLSGIEGAWVSAKRFERGVERDTANSGSRCILTITYRSTLR
jgi:hypothetical protein